MPAAINNQTRYPGIAHPKIAEQAEAAMMLHAKMY
jgi:hypothetical protein